MCMYNKRTYRDNPEHIVHTYVLYILGKSQRGKLLPILLFPEACMDWVPNLFETMSHCLIDNSEMSQCAIAHRKLYALYRTQVLGPTCLFDFWREILNSESGEHLSSLPQGKNLRKHGNKKNVKQEYALKQSRFNYQFKPHMTPSPQSVWGCMWKIWLWCAKSRCVMTLCSWVCFDTRFLLMRYGVKLTQPAPLLDAAEFSETRSSLVWSFKLSKTHVRFIVLLTSFAEFGFQNGLKLA